MEEFPRSSMSDARSGETGNHVAIRAVPVSFRPETGFGNRNHQTLEKSRKTVGFGPVGKEPQLLETNACCQKAVGLIQSWCRASKLPVPSSDTSSYCKVRCRLRLSFLQQIHQRIITHLSGRIGSRDQWSGFTLKAMDGSSVQLMDTAQNQLPYPQPSVQKPGCGFPTMGIVGLLNLGHGGWKFTTIPHPP